MARHAAKWGVVLSILLLAGAAGCTWTQESSTSTTATSSSVSVAVSDTSASVITTTTMPRTSTTVEATTTTEASDSTSTTGSSTTLAPEVQGTTTTVTIPPPATPTEDVLYAIDDWSTGVSGWAAAGQWKTVGGMLVTDGTSDSFAVAPVDLTDYPDYAVECEVQIVHPDDGTVVMLLARLINGTAYYGGFDGAAPRMVVGFDTIALGDARFVLDSEWHKYRLEVRGNSIKLFMEQAEVARATDNTRLQPGTVGIYCGNGQINVRMFRVIEL